jgi:hypothetical protein
LVWGRYKSSNRMYAMWTYQTVIHREPLLYQANITHELLVLKNCVVNQMLCTEQCASHNFWVTLLWNDGTLILSTGIVDVDWYKVGWIGLNGFEHFYFIIHNSVPVWCHDSFRAKNWMQTYTTTDRPYIKVIWCLPQS